MRGSVVTGAVKREVQAVPSAFVGEDAALYSAKAISAVTEGELSRKSWVVESVKLIGREF